MKPYIETATETQALEMEKWNKSQYRSQIIQLLDKADEKELIRFLKYLKAPKKKLKTMENAEKKKINS